MVHLTSSLLLLTVSTLSSATQWGQYHNTNNNKATSVAGNIDKKIVDYEHQDDKVQAIVNRGNKMQKIVENLLKRNQHKKREIFQRNVKNIISKNLRTESGLNVVIKQILRNKLKNLQEKAHGEKSAVQILLDKSSRSPNFLDQTVGRSETFLDKLINVMKKEDENINTVIQQARKPKVLNIDSKEEQVEGERPLRFFEEVGLVENANQNRVINEIEEQAEKENGFNFFADVGLVGGNSENKDNVDKNTKQEHPSTNSFLEEEINAAESETAFLADEIAEILVQIDADLGAEDQMMTHSDEMIQAKLRRYPMEMLLRDRDFIDSVFIRFALMRLPLRTQDIDVSESFQINKVLQASMAQASAETRSLLEDLRTDPLQGGDARDRAQAIDQSRRQLQKLLNIVTKKI